VEPERSYTALVSYLPLKSFRKLPQFLWYVVQIQGQLKRSPGLVGYTLQARIFRKVFFTLSVWDSETALRAFVQQAPHVLIMGKLAGHMAKTEFQQWSVKGSELPLVFEKELYRLSRAGVI
jgi:hypothetical protein